jgi:L-amino acid N-acyltransferase YncA
VAPHSPFPPLIRPARATDMASVREIYGHYVETSCATFEDVVPSEGEMIGRWQAVVERHLPFLVIEDAGTVLGFAYAAPFRQRSGYRYTLEDSIYLAPAASGRGLGRRLLADLISHCEALGFRQMVAVIGDSANLASIRLHASLAFRPAGVLSAAGFKFARWIDSVYMQRPLGDGDRSLPVF